MKGRYPFASESNPWLPTVLHDIIGFALAPSRTSAMKISVGVCVLSRVQ
jgi:hypothetical protein